MTPGSPPPGTRGGRLLQKEVVHGTQSAGEFRKGEDGREESRSDGRVAHSSDSSLGTEARF